MHQRKSKKLLIYFFLLITISFALFQVLNVIGENQSKYSVDNMFNTIQTAQSWHTQISQEGKKDNADSATTTSASGESTS